MLSTETHMNKVCSCGFYYLHNLRRIRKYLSQDCLVTLIHVFVTGRLDYCNSLMYCLPQWQISKLKRVQNAAARITLNLSKFWHITPALRQLHWLPVVKRFISRSCFSLSRLFTVSLLPTSVNLNCQTQIYLRSPLKQQYCAATFYTENAAYTHLVLAPLLLLPLRFGTNCLLILEMLLSIKTFLFNEAL